MAQTPDREAARATAARDRARGRVTAITTTVGMAGFVASGGLAVALAVHPNEATADPQSPAAATGLVPQSDSSTADSQSGSSSSGNSSSGNAYRDDDGHESGEHDSDDDHESDDHESGEHDSDDGHESDDSAGSRSNTGGSSSSTGSQSTTTVPQLVVPQHKSAPQATTGGS